MADGVTSKPSALTWLSVVDASGLDFAALRGRVVDEMKHAKAVRVIGATHGMQDARPFWKDIGEALGDSMGQIEDSLTGEGVDGVWMDVRYEPDRLDTYRHASVGQPLHTDGAYVEHAKPRAIVLFYLARQAESGGHSLFIDADTLAAAAQTRAPALYKQLTTTPVAFGKANRAPRVTTILRQEDGITRLNWNYYRVLPDQGPEIAALRERFREFLEELVEDGTVAAFRLESGDAVFFYDDDVLHGRRSFEAKQAGDRLLWKTYFTPRA